MSILKRYYFPGNTYFISCVTYNRLPILTGNINLFWQAIRSAQRGLKFEIMAWAVLPDHFHTIIYPEEKSPAEIIHRIKLSFGALYRKRNALKSSRLWQSRFWDHVIRNERDLKKHIDYIHYNPVKHGLTGDPFAYEHSSIKIFYGEGIYPSGWKMESDMVTGGEFGDD